MTGCIAGGGEPYDDSESVYEPTITLNETVVDDERYELILVDIKRKSHPDVGEMVDVNFRCKNKTDENVFITTDVVKFDGEDMSVRVMAFFNELTANSDGTTTAIFQEIKEQNWALDPLKKSLEMELEIVNEDSETIATYPIAVSF
ncbi:MAG: hypothetical protein ABS948_02400 [Solibacillus sp.]